MNVDRFTLCCQQTLISNPNFSTSLSIFTVKHRIFPDFAFDEPRGSTLRAWRSDYSLIRLVTANKIALFLSSCKLAWIDHRRCDGHFGSSLLHHGKVSWSSDPISNSGHYGMLAYNPSENYAANSSLRRSREFLGHAQAHWNVHCYKCCARAALNTVLSCVPLKHKHRFVFSSRFIMVRLHFNQKDEKRTLLLISRVLQMK